MSNIDVRYGRLTRGSGNLHRLEENESLRDRIEENRSNHVQISGKGLLVDKETLERNLKLGERDTLMAISYSNCDLDYVDFHLRVGLSYTSLERIEEILSYVRGIECIRNENILELLSETYRDSLLEVLKIRDICDRTLDFMIDQDYSNYSRLEEEVHRMYMNDVYIQNSLVESVTKLVTGKEHVVSDVFRFINSLDSKILDGIESINLSRQVEKFVIDLTKILAGYVAPRVTDMIVQLDLDLSDLVDKKLVDSSWEVCDYILDNYMEDYDKSIDTVYDLCIEVRKKMLREYMENRLAI